MGDGVSGAGEVGLTSDTGVTLLEVRNLIEESMSTFSATVASSMRESFCNIEELISTKVDSVRQEFNALLPDSPSLPPVRKSSSQGRQDPSQGRLVTDYGKSGADLVDPEEEELTGSPGINVDSLFDALSSAGFMTRQ